MMDEDLYQMAADELNSDRRRQDLWRRACTLASDDHDEARYLYTTLRVDELTTERDAASDTDDGDVIDATIVDEDDTLVRATLDETVDGEEVQSFIEELSLADPDTGPGMASSHAIEVETPGIVDSSIEFMPMDNASLNTPLQTSPLEDKAGNSPINEDLADDPDADLMADYREDSDRLRGTGHDDVEASVALNNDLAGDFSLYSNSSEQQADADEMVYPDDTAADGSMDISGEVLSHNSSDNFGMYAEEYAGDETANLTQANVTVLDAYSDELDEMLDKSSDRTETVSAADLPTDFDATEADWTESEQSELTGFTSDAPAASDDDPELILDDTGERSDAVISNIKATGLTDTEWLLDGEHPAAAASSGFTDSALNDDLVVATGNNFAEDFNRQAEELDLDDSSREHSPGRTNESDTLAGIENTDGYRPALDAPLEGDLDLTSVRPREHDSTGTQPSFDLGDADVPAIAAATVRPVPVPANLDLGPAQENTYDANASYANEDSPLDLTTGRKGKLYSIYRRNNEALAVNNGVSWSALFLTLPFLIFRTLFGTAFIYLVLWIISIGGLLVTGLAWMDAGDAVTPAVQAGAIGFGLLAFIGLIYLPFRYGNLWRIDKLEERGYELVAITRAKNPGLAMARARRHSVIGD